jgi:hypothetical protein
MVVTSAKYFKHDNQNAGINAEINGKEWAVPLDTANTHYQAIQEWVSAGNTIEAAD